MKDTFENLKHWLMHRQDSYWYEGHDGSVQFDMQAMLGEITAFAEEFEKQIQ